MIGRATEVPVSSRARLRLAGVAAGRRLSALEAAAGRRGPRRGAAAGARLAERAAARSPWLGGGAAGGRTRSPRAAAARVDHLRRRPRVRRGVLVRTRRATGARAR